MRYDYTEVLAIVDKILNCDGKFDGTMDSWNDRVDSAERHVSEISDWDISFSRGQTKGVIISNAWDFVVKVPFVAEHDKINYCALEYANYCQFFRNNMDEVCAWIEPIGRVNNIPIYAQEYVTCDEDEVSNSLYEMQFDHWVANGCYIDEDEMNAEDRQAWESNSDSDDVKHDIFDAYVYSGNNGGDWWQIRYLFEKYYDTRIIDKCDMLIDALNINDIHTANVGYRNNGAIVLVDFSGYYRKKVLANCNFANFKSIIRI